MTLYIAVIGTSDQSCWLAEACKILLLLLLLEHVVIFHDSRHLPSPTCSLQAVSYSITAGCSLTGKVFWCPIISSFFWP